MINIDLISLYFAAVFILGEKENFSHHNSYKIVPPSLHSCTIKRHGHKECYVTTILNLTTFLQEPL